MKLIDGIAMSARDINRRKLRSILTIIAISVGSMLLVSMQGLGGTISKTATTFVSSFGNLDQVMVTPEKYNVNKSSQAIQQQMNQGMSYLPYQANKQLNPKEQDNSKEITNSTLASIAKIENVKNISAYNATQASSVSIEGVTKSGVNPTLLGYSKEYEYTGQGTIVAGKDLTGVKDQFLVNENYLKNMGVTDYNSVVGKTITFTVNMPSVPGMPTREPLIIKGTVQGVYSNPNSYYPGNILTLNNVTNEISAYYTGKTTNQIESTYSMVTINVPNQKVIPQINNTVNNTLGYTTFSLGEIVGMASVFTSFITIVLDIAAIIVILVASVGLINTMTMTVQEKKKWIGIMRALGAKKGNIRLIFLTQSIILGTIGGILGCILAIIAIFGINEYLIQVGKSFTVNLTVGNVLLGFIVAIIVSIIAGIIPAGRAAKLDVVETINEE
ncbi:MAG: ABC transporter permease [Sarcina sp.]